MKAFTVLLGTALMVGMVTGQSPFPLPGDSFYYPEPQPLPQPFQNPGEIIPGSGFDIKFLINAAGGIWQQDRVIDSMAYVCKDVLPVVGSMIPEVDPTSLYWGYLCDEVIEASTDLDAFDATGFCNDIITVITGIISQGSEGRYRRQAEPSMEYPESMGDPLDIIEILFNITRDLYGIDINMIINDPSTIDTICTNVKENFLRPSVEEVISQLATELMSALLPQAAPICQNWEGFLEVLEIDPTSPVYPIIEQAAHIGSQALGYDHFDALCEAINQTLEDDDINARRTFSRNVIENFIGLLENGERCTTLGNNAITSLVGSNLGQDYYQFSSAGNIQYQLYIYTGFWSAEEICYALEEAITTEVELPAPRVDLIPGTDLTPMFFVNAAGGLWQQDRLIDTMAYACSDVLPAITVMVPVVGYYAHVYDPICQEIRKAATDLDAFDSTGFCNDSIEMTRGLFPGDPADDGSFDISGSIDDPMGIIGTLINITRDLYGINVNDLSTICPNVHQFLDQPLPGIISEFGTELMTSLLPLAEPVCNWGAFLEGFGVNSSSPYYQISENAARIASRAMGYDDREALCQDLDAIPAEGDEARRTFSRNIIFRMFELPTDGDRCSILASETLEGVVEPVLRNVLPSGTSIRISDYLISRYSGYENVYDFCQHLETAFTSEVPLVRPAYGEIIPGSDLTVSLLINLAGSLWEQDRAIDSYAYICTDILPILLRTIPELRQSERYWTPICKSVVEAADDSNGFDATGLCYGLESSLSSLLGPFEPYPGVPSDGGVSYNMSSEGSWSSETVEYINPIVQILMNISQIYGIDINNISTVCTIASDLLEPSLSDLVLDFGSRILSFFLPQASPICQDVDAFLNGVLMSFRIDSSSPFYQIIQDAIDIVPRLVGYSSRQALCQQINQTLQYEGIDDPERLDFTRGLITDILSLTTAVGRCGSISNDIIHDVVEPLINVDNPGEMVNVTDDIIHQYTGFLGVRPICRALASAFRGCPKRFDLDACGVCVPRLAGSIEYHFTSDQTDCTGRCPRDVDYGAILNECGRCVAGATGRPVDAGMNECGSCGYLGGRSCVGCDGVINSGKVYDACMVCGGDGTTCTEVSSISPKVIPAETEYEITIFGAGFDPAPDCRFTHEGGIPNRQVTMATSSASEGTCTVTLPAAGTYDLLLDFGSSDPLDTSIRLEVYDPVTIASVAPEEITLDPTSLVTLTFTAADNSNLQAVEGMTPYLIFENGLEPLAGEISGDSMTMQELTFTLRPPPTAMQLVVSPSLNGIDALPGGPFTVTFFAPAPAIGSLTFFPSRNRLLLEFEDGVRIDNLDDCSILFQVSVEENGIARNLLGTGSRCMLIRNNRVISITLGEGDDLIGPDDTLTLRGGVIFSRPEFSRAATETVLSVEVGELPTVNVVLQGFSKISSCGDVQMSARGTKGGAGRPLTYTWSVQSGVEVSSDLEDAVTAITTADLTVDGALLTANQAYTFSIEAVNFLGGSGSDSIVVTRSAEQVPDLRINPRGIDPENVAVSKRFFLDADVTFYSDCEGAGPEETEFVWTANSETFNSSIHRGTANYRTLFINAYSFTGDSDVTFTVQARRAGATSGPTSDITIRFASSELVARIRGGSEKSVGVDSGTVTLDGSRSSDPDLPSDSDQSSDLTYEWSCEQTTDGTLCASAQDGSIFPADSALSSSTLTFDADDMTPGKTYQFTLDVSSGNRRASTSVLIDAVAGDPPLILISRSTEGPVLSTEPVSLTALVDHTSPDDIAWTITGHDIDLDYDLDGNAQDIPIQSSTFSFTSIDAGILQPGEMYTVDVTVTYGSDLTTYGQLVLDVAEGVSSCQVSLESGNTYTVLDEIAFLVDDCVTDEGAYPLTYQLFVRRNEAGNTRSLTRPGGDSRISVRGPPVRRDGNRENTFVIKVCNQHSSCTSYSVMASVQPRQSFNYEELKQSIVEQEAFKGDYISAFRNINALIRVLLDQLGSGRKKRATTTSQQTADQLMLLQEAIDETVLDVSSAATLLDECPSIEVNDLSKEDLGSFVGILQTLVSVFFSEMGVLPPSTHQALVPITMDIEEATDDEDILDMLRYLIMSLTRASLVRDTVGDIAVETVSAGVTSSAIVALPLGAHQSNSGEDALTVDFGTEVAERYGVWECDSGSCVGVLVQFDQYSDDLDPYSTNDEDRNNRASEILQISLYDPSSPVSELIVDSLTDPISISMEITRPKQDRTYECTFWNITCKIWSTSGVETVMKSETEVECRTNHLSAFTVLAGEEIEFVPTSGPSPGGKSNTGLIVGCVIAGLVAIVIIIGIVLYLSKYKKVGTTDKEMGLQLTKGGPKDNTTENAYDFSMDQPM